MASIFERKAKMQAWVVFGAFPVAGFLAVLLTQLTRGADSSSPFFWIGIAGIIVGYGALVYTKWDQILRGDFFTWGLTTKSKTLSALYYISYGLMVFGFLVAGSSGLL